MSSSDEITIDEYRALIGEEVRTVIPDEITLEEFAKLEKHSESKLQTRLFSWSRLQGLMWPELVAMHHVRNEGERSAEGHAIAVRMGLLPGIPDICLPVRGRGWWERYNCLRCELKRPGKRPTKTQVKTMRMLSRPGIDNFCFATDDFDDFVMVVTEYLGYSEYVSNPMWFIANDFFVLRRPNVVQGQLFGELPY